MQTPTIGRTVLFHVLDKRPGREGRIVTRPAVIVEVFNPNDVQQTVNLRVLLDGRNDYGLLPRAGFNNDPEDWVTSIPVAAGPEHGCYSWPVMSVTRGERIPIPGNPTPTATAPTPEPSPVDSRPEASPLEAAPDPSPAAAPATRDA